MEIFYSNIGGDELKNIPEFEKIAFNGKLKDLINILNSKNPGFRNLILDRHDKIKSSVSIFKNIYYDGKRIYDSENTQLIKNTDDLISNDDKILISIFNTRKLGQLLETTLKNPEYELLYKDPKELDLIPLTPKKFLNDVYGPLEEPVMSFRSGETTLKDLEIPKGKFVDIVTKNYDNIYDLFDRNSSRLLPSSLLKAIKKIWDLDSLDSRLYLHQEDCLFYILGKLRNPQEVPNESLLLAIPTGGGKTEAFLIPIISHILNKKNNFIYNNKEPENKISSIITYPTKALANDQANRIIEILHEVNKHSTPHQQITIGVLTGDTPNWGGYELNSRSVIQVCPNCQSSYLEYVKSDSKNNKYYARCKHCDNEIDFIILTREDILSFPPDILVTNLDMINFCLQSPKMRRLFRPEKSDFDLMIFDEVHLCESVFGCHTGHLLRRLESTCGRKPLYVGVSATIGNAEELASLVFDVEKDDILYLNEKKRKYLRSEIDHYRYHYILTPYKWKKPDKYHQVVTTALNVVDVTGHAIRDPHFRKTIVFSNFRQDTDNLVKYLRDQEDRYFKIYRDEIHPKIELNNELNKTEKRIAENIGSWYHYLLENRMLYNEKLVAGWHRGGLEQKERLRAITRFTATKELEIGTESRIKPVDVMMATNTLELGIDIGDVTNVINCSAPFTVNEYVQRSGRGGRKKDSTTLTIIDPTNPLDFYLKRHFNEYVVSEDRNFEDAPIIITNESILEAHLQARILEFLADHLIDKSVYKKDIKVEDLEKLEIDYNGEKVKFMDDPEIIGEAIFDKFFKTRYVLDVNQNNKTAIEIYEEWFPKEHKLLGVKKFEKNEEDFKNTIISKCKELRKKIESKKLDIHGNLGGMRPVDNTLVPKMRGSGSTCNILLVRDKIDEIKDSVSRRRVMTNMPPDGYTTQGANTFKIQRNINNDPDTVRNVKKLLRRDKKAVDFFKENFKEYFSEDIDDLELKSPKDLYVRFYPFRFYCAKCGKTFTESPNDDRCSDCNSELRQLTEVYLCEHCGEIFEPPVPKVCINPLHIKNDQKFMKSLNDPNGPKPDYDRFHFNALPELQWQCRNCKTIFNFHYKPGITLPESFINKQFNFELTLDNPEDVAKRYQYRPEAINISLQNYLRKGKNLARYSCNNCGRPYTVKAKNVPTVRNVVVDYISEDKDLMEDEKISFGTLNFKQVEIVELSRDYTRKFYTKETMKVESREIFPAEQYSFLTNNYRTHAAFLKIDSDIIDNFLNTQNECIEKNCEKCNLIKTVSDYNITGPSIELKEWEKDRYPDVRKRWCLNTEKCLKESCKDCPELSRKQYLKYLLIHALKHALIIAMPKYLGIKKNEMRGIIHPNNNQNIDICFLDVHEDGSGSIYLLKRNWKDIWNLAGELLNNVREDKGSLLLPQFCQRHNIDLCPFIGSNFFNFLNNQK